MSEELRRMAIFCSGYKTRKYRGEQVFTTQSKKQIKNVAKAVKEWAAGDDIVVQFAIGMEKTARAIAAEIKPETVVTYNEELRFEQMPAFVDGFWLNLPSRVRIVCIMDSRTLFLALRDFVYSKRKEEFKELACHIDDPGFGIFMKLELIKYYNTYLLEPERLSLQNE
ncbi:MAG: hypothetical protein LBK50_01525 [Candidatus Nomurabacteria bacterium]|jgi:hypothetical protein|nr:hypothetical protein [Candidatus Nomurabacteria bacterium]